MGENPLVSVVIATRNRQQYATVAVRSLCRSIPRKDAEFVVQDSGDDASLGNYINSEINDPRVRYYYSPPPLNMTQNYNLAIAHATGCYVCMIGDDDGVNPEIMEAAGWAEENDIDALAPKGVASYFWPDFRSRYYGERHGGKVYLKQFSGRISRLNPQGSVRQFIRHAGFGIDQWGLPKVYLGLIRRDRLEEIKSRTGCYFSGISPDIYGAITAAHVCRNAFSVDYPLILGGNSGGSNSGLSARRRHKGTFEEAAHLRNYSLTDWPDGMPKYWVNETAYSSAALTALRDLGRLDLVRDFNYPLLHAMCLISHPDYRAETFRSYRCALSIMGVGRFRGMGLLAVNSALDASRRFAWLGRRLLAPGPAAGATVCPGLQDIEAAVHGLAERLKEDSVCFRHLREGAASRKAGEVKA